MGSKVLAGSAALTLTAAVAMLAYATVSPASQIFGATLLAPRKPGELALTFDDGPNPTATPRLLDLLELHNIQATFFLIGRYALAEPQLVRRIINAGHSLGNHTMTHPRLPLCSHARIAAELTDAQHAIEDTAGTPVRLFRPPHGFRTPHVLRTASALGLTTTTWNLIANDWSLLTAEKIIARVEAGITRNQRRGFASNVVLHDGSQSSPAADRHRSVVAAAALIEHHLAQGAEFVLLDRWI